MRSSHDDGGARIDSLISAAEDLIRTNRALVAEAASTRAALDAIAARLTALEVAPRVAAAALSPRGAAAGGESPLDRVAAISAALGLASPATPAARAPSPSRIPRPSPGVAGVGARPQRPPSPSRIPRPPPAKSTASVSPAMTTGPRRAVGTPIQATAGPRR